MASREQLICLGLTETASTTTFNISAEERKAYSVGKPSQSANQTSPVPRLDSITSSTRTWH